MIVLDENAKASPVKSATIKDVAKLSGTSIATVSRVLSDNGYPVTPRTRNRILEAAKALNYSPNLIGHMLKTKTNKCLGIIIPSFQNPFFTQLVMGIENAAKAEGYFTFVFSSQRDMEIERKLISQLSQLRISGMLLSSIDPSSAAVEAYLDSGATAAIFEADFPIDPRVIDATSNMDENGYIATQALLTLGHRQIAFLTTPLTRHNRQMVHKGYRQAMEEYGLRPTVEDVFESSFERELDDALFEFEAGKELAKQLRQSKRSFTGVVAVNDLVACGVIHELVHSGVSVPESLSVVGVDDIPQCIFIHPTLTTVNQGSYQQGYSTCQALIQRLESGQRPEHQRCYRKPELVIRDSVRPLT